MADVFPEGVWIDTRTGAVVLAQPVEGVQIAAPGVPVPPGQEAAVAEAVASAKAAPVKRAAPKLDAGDPPAEDQPAGDVEDSPKPRARTRKA